MLFDASTPDTSSYMIAGYAVFFIITAIYLVSLIVRSRNLDRDLATLETLEGEQQAQAPVAAPVEPARAPKAPSKAKARTAAAKKTSRKPQPKNSRKK